MRQGLIAWTLALWWVVYALGYHADFAGPFANEAVCAAAEHGALEFGKPSVCVPEERIDDYLDSQRYDYDSGEGGPT